MDGGGKDTFITRQRVDRGTNALATHPERYITLESTDLQQTDAHILLSSEPYPFGDKHIQSLLDLGIDRTQFILLTENVIVLGTVSE